MSGAASQAGLDQPSRTIGWPRSPSVLFGIAAGFFLVMGAIFIYSGLLPTQMPVLKQGQIAHVVMGYLWLPIAAPFAVFALLYAAVEFGMRRTFDQSSTRIHFICTIFAVLEAIRVYAGWAASNGSPNAEVLTGKSFGGLAAFLMLAIAAFVWNVSTSKSRS